MTELIASMSIRLDDIRKFLHQASQQLLLAKQAHLDEGTAERAYWHAGYASALQDLLLLLPSHDGKMSS